MGGYNSGRPKTHSAYLDDCLTLPAGKLRKSLVTGSRLGWAWHRGEAKAGEITIAVEADAIRLIYATTGDNPQQTDERVTMSREARYLGGEQLYLHCPRCSRRSSKLYLYRTRFTCRQCTGLTYRTKAQSVEDRLYRAHNRYRRKLDSNAAELDPGLLPDKPKGMHWKTYDEICRKALEAEHQRWEVLNVKLAGTLRRLGVIGDDLLGLV